MAELYDAEGNLVEEVFTKEELEAAKEELESKNSLAEEEKRELEELRKKDFNFNKLRKAAEEKKQDTKKEDDKTKQSSEEAEKILGDMKIENEGLKKKAIYFHNKLTQGIDDPDMRRLLMDDALSLAKRSIAENGQPLGGATSASSGSNTPPSSTAKRDQNFKEHSSIFNLSDEDVDKYDPENGQTWRPNLGK